MPIGLNILTVGSEWVIILSPPAPLTLDRDLLARWTDSLLLLLRTFQIVQASCEQ